MEAKSTPGYSTGPSWLLLFAAVLLQAATQAVAFSQPAVLQINSFDSSSTINTVASSSPQTFLLHIHIPKTGGTTFSKEFPKMYSDIVKECNLVRTHSIRFSDAISTVRNFSDCNFISFESGPWIERYLPPSLDIKTMVMLRNPLDLRISGLEHYRRLSGVDPDEVLQRVANGEHHKGYHMQNSQVKELICDTDPVRQQPFVPCNYTMEAAIAKLNSFWWVGITEYYKESMCILAYQLGKFPGELCKCGSNLSIKKHNYIPSDKAKVHSYSVQQMKFISKLNRDDFLLYSMAVARMYSDAAEVERATGVPLFC